MEIGHSDINPDLMTNKAAVTASAVESFSDISSAREAWPPKVSKDEVFVAQIEKRHEINRNLDAIMKCIPNPTTTLQEALETNIINERQAEGLYESLSDLLDDIDYKRVALYIPFEYLPEKDWQPSSSKLAKASERFRKSYLDAWYSLLKTHDVKANFVDGDVIEVDQRETDLPRVVKAAHLIPKLLELGLLDIEEVVDLIENTDDPILQASILDTFPVLADLGLLGDANVTGPDQLVPEDNSEQKDVSLCSVHSQLNTALAEAEEEDYGDITKRRRAWIIKTKIQDEVGRLATDVRDKVVAGNLSPEMAEEFLSLESNSNDRWVIIDGIRQGIETIAIESPEKALALYQKYMNFLSKIAEGNDVVIRQSIAKTFRHLHQLGIVDGDKLADMNIALPKLAGPFSENLKLMPNEMRQIQKMVELVKANPELSALIYPVALVYGSRLKGYGEDTSDIDLGVFVRPGTSAEELHSLRKMLDEAFVHGSIHDEPKEFWLDNAGDELRIHDFPQSEPPFGESYWAHILFGAAWAGDKDEIKDLRQKLLTPYMYDTDKKIYGINARRLYLEELEKDTLQYRLMHNGHERFFPSYGGINTPHADRIDGKSMFYDSGYRRIATKLFASRVFIPKLSK